MTLKRWVTASAGIGVALACASAEPAGPVNVASAPTAPTTRGGSPPSAESAAVDETKLTSVQEDGAPEVAVLDPEVLEALASKGFGLAKLVLDEDAATTAELDRLPAFKSIFDVSRADIRATTRTHPLAKVTSMDGFRLFDAGLLTSKQASFELTGVFNRLDRRAFNAGTCGEVRFLYRLRYRTEQGGAPMSGRLPMTVNVVFLMNGDNGCQGVAKSWEPPKRLEGAALVTWLLDEGPLAPGRRATWTLKSLETNTQTFRLQSSVLPSLGGHIEYVLRVFHPRDATRRAFAPAPMENMPDAAALAHNPKLKQELLAYLREPAVLAAVDRGTLSLPEKFLATRALSVSPRGLTRLANRPFRQLFEPSDFADLTLGSYRTIRSSVALLRRLDGASCTGCHQSRSIAGFHHVGRDRADAPAWSALVSGSSAHLESDLERRRAYVAALAAGNVPDEFRPLPERQGVGQGFGAPCGLGDAGLADWTCATGFACTKLEDPEVGVCLTDSTIGSPCEYGEMRSGSKPHRDRVLNLSEHACPSNERCYDNFGGFPQGTCVAACSAKTPSLSCASFLDVDGFQNCLRARTPYESCAKGFVGPTGVRACDASNPCRQDYVCARTEKQGVGACIPPYFVYGLRLDGFPFRR